MNMKQSRYVCSSIVLALCICGLFDVGAESLPRINIPSCNSLPIVDGVLTDACWKEAAVIPDMERLKVNSPVRTDDTQAWLIHDDQWLYMAFKCKHPNPATLEQSVFGRDEVNIFKDDSVEIFLHPETPEKSYYHFALTFANIRAERRINEDGARDLGWDIPRPSATRRTKTGWEGEMAIPLFILAGPEGVRNLRANIGRNMVETQFSEGGTVRTGVEHRYYSWAPVKAPNWFHDLADYGRFDGLESTKVKIPLLPVIESARCDNYILEEGKYSYPVSVTLRGHTDRSGKTLVTVKDIPLSGKSSETSTEIVLNGKQPTTAEIDVPVQELGERSVNVMVASDIKTGSILQTIPAENATVLTTMSRPLLDRNYYTDEEAAIALCRIGLPTEELKNVMLMATDGKTVLAQRESPTAETDFRIPLKDIPVGAHDLSIELKRKEGETLFTGKVRLIKKEPRPGCEVKINPINRCFIKDGKPLFPMGFLMHNCWSVQDKQFKKLADGGFNLLLRWWDAGTCQTKTSQDYLETAGKYGLMVMERPEAFGKHKSFIYMKDKIMKVRLKDTIDAYAYASKFTEWVGLTHEEQEEKFVEAIHENLPDMEEVVRKARNYPNLFGYFAIDEPHPPVFDLVMRGCKILYDTYNGIDGYHPIYILYGAGGFIPDLAKGTAYCNTFGCDPYWVPEGDTANCSPATVAMQTAQINKKGEMVHQPNIIVPMSEIYSGTYKRVPLPQEERSQTYLAVVNGARGVMYYTGPVYHQHNWREMSAVAQEIKAMTPTLLNRGFPQEVTYTPGGEDVAGGNCPDVQVRLYENPEGGYILLAVSSAYYPVDVTCTVEGLGKKGEVTRLFGKDKYAVADDSFSDRIDWLDTRAYVLNPDKPLSKPIRIEINMKAYPEQARKFTEVIPVSGRQGKKNIAQNPGFEDATLVAWPDYCMPTPNRPVVGPDEGAEWGLVKDDPYEGDYCLRMKSVIQKNSLRAGVRCKLTKPKGEAASPFVVSVYIKADNDKMTGTLNGKKIKLTTSWKRYSAPFRGGVVLYAYGEGTAWVDAIQVEKGNEPTDFEK